MGRRGPNRTPPVRISAEAAPTHVSQRFLSPSFPYTCLPLTSNLCSGSAAAAPYASPSHRPRPSRKAVRCEHATPLFAAGAPPGGRLVRVRRRLHSPPPPPRCMIIMRRHGLGPESRSAPLAAREGSIPSSPPPCHILRCSEQKVSPAPHWRGQRRPESLHCTYVSYDISVLRILSASGWRQSVPDFRRHYTLRKQALWPKAYHAMAPSIVPLSISLARASRACSPAPPKALGSLSQ